MEKLCVVSGAERGGAEMRKLALAVLLSLTAFSLACRTMAPTNITFNGHPPATFKNIRAHGGRR